VGGGWGDKLRRAFVYYLEETEVTSREVQPGPARIGMAVITMAEADVIGDMFYRVWVARS